MLLFYRVSAIALASICFGLPAFAQDLPASDPRAEPLVTDRPDFTESALTIPQGLYQAEFGTTFTKSGSDKENGFGELLMRIGLNKRTELRVGVPTYLTTRAAQSGRTSGFSDASLGFKFSLASAGAQLGLRQFDVGLIVATTLPTGSRAYRGKYLQPGAKLLLASALTETIAVSANLNYDYVSENDDQFGEVSSSLSFGFVLNERTGAYLEYFGFYPSGEARDDSNFVNTGATYLLNNDLQLDARVGKGLSKNQDDYFIGAGASVRF